MDVFSLWQRPSGSTISFCCRRIKISDVVADGFLPIELHAEDLFSPQAVPQV
jgi:hypothetical protein